MLPEYVFVIQYRPGNTNDNADASSRISITEKTDSNLNSCHKESQCELIGLSRFPAMKEIRSKQLNLPVLGKMLYESEMIPYSQRFSTPQWNRSELKRNKQIGSQLQLVDGAVIRNYKTIPFSDLLTVIVAPEIMRRDLL
ncbi:hypothetical protein LOD99_6421 [Oopsacas minuta]|uniref:Uncharacterized protein n=1 Tax=Oopsacas minuta TaxID=111878 RepID=A0AAV7JNA6_9METZ|nr:hypothetical protein LOD99_6421 [Oopsacas minuta]